MDPFRETSMMLARSVLGQDQHDRKPHSATSSPELARAQMTVDLRLESMVRGICQQVWVDQAAVAANIEARVREAISEANIEKEIAHAVKIEIERMRSWISQRVLERIKQRVDQAIDERIGDAPRLYAKRITDKMWTAFFGRPPGKSNIYGRASAPRRKK